MSGSVPPPVTWQESDQVRTLAVNVGARYVTLALELLLGLLMLPFNARHLGASDYGLWMLAASIVAYFPIIDLGYSGALERFVAHYRARREAQAINEISSTLVFMFAAMGVVALAIMSGIAWNLGSFFDLDPARARTGGVIMLLVAVQFAFGFPFAVFGAVVNGFQRTYLNSIVGIGVSLTVALVNVVVLQNGGSLVQLVAALTATRILGFLLYRVNAYRVFPLLRIRPALFRWSRMREMAQFSVYMLVQDASSRVNYAADPIVIAAFLSTGAVAMWTVAQRLADVVLQLTNQFNYVLFPVVVDCDTAQRDSRLRDLLLQGTRLSLATTLPVAGSLILLAEPVINGWAGPEFHAAIRVLQLLTLVVLVRVGSATSSTVLQGAGHLRLLSYSNLVAAGVNIALSVILIRTYGLPGVAFATLLPVLVRACAVLIPVAARRVGVSLSEFVSFAVWPAAWPALIALPTLIALRPKASLSFGYAVLHGGGVGVLYWALFIAFAISRDDRNRYLGKLRSIARWPALEAA
jgi:O-antigen/teichoic acid export membrane protein